jgi:hypothetical protein
MTPKTRAACNLVFYCSIEAGISPSDARDLVVATLLAGARAAIDLNAEEKIRRDITQRTTGIVLALRERKAA